MACFNCNLSGHWAKECPSAVCTFCNAMGHTAAYCSLQKNYKNDMIVVDVPKRKSRTRLTMVSGKTLSDILYENHVAVQPSMRKDIDSYIKTHFYKCGYVDSLELSTAIFDNIVCNFDDEGHMTVIGYILAKYCEVSHPSVKAFLRLVIAETTPERYKALFNRKFGVCAYMKGQSWHFRKLSGFCV